MTRLTKYTQGSSYPMASCIWGERGHASLSICRRSCLSLGRKGRCSLALCACRPPHPVEHVCPAFHGDALEDGQHGEEEVVEVGDASVGPCPAPAALGLVQGARTPGSRRCAGRRVLLRFHVCGKTGALGSEACPPTVPAILELRPPEKFNSGFEIFLNQGQL